MKPSTAKLMFILAALVLAAATFMSYEALVEAYGSSSPYYSRTTKMDKWTDPWPEVVLIDLMALTAAATLI